jgi:ACT domain-containing protein
MSVSAPQKEELTTDEAIAYLHISRDTFYRWRRSGKIVPFNLNDALDRQPNPLYKRADLDGFLAARRNERLRKEAASE